MGISLGELDLSDQIQASYDINSMDDFYDISFNKKRVYFQPTQKYHLSSLALIGISLTALFFVSKMYNSTNQADADRILFGAY